MRLLMIKQADLPKAIALIDGCWIAKLATGISDLRGCKQWDWVGVSTASKPQDTSADWCAISEQYVDHTLLSLDHIWAECPMGSDGMPIPPLLESVPDFNDIMDTSGCGHE